jgi:hypothetical protein
MIDALLFGLASGESGLNGIFPCIPVVNTVKNQKENKLRIHNEHNL